MKFFTILFHALLLPCFHLLCFSRERNISRFQCPTVSHSSYHMACFCLYSWLELHFFIFMNGFNGGRAYISSVTAHILYDMKSLYQNMLSPCNKFMFFHSHPPPFVIPLSWFSSWAFGNLYVIIFRQSYQAWIPMNS